MPTIFLEGYAFRFYSSDVNEPPHMHVIKGERVAKIWLQPIELETNRGYNKSEINKILRITEAHQMQLIAVWHEHFNQ